MTEVTISWSEGFIDSAIAKWLLNLPKEEAALLQTTDPEREEEFRDLLKRRSGRELVSIANRCNLAGSHKDLS